MRHCVGDRAASFASRPGGILTDRVRPYLFYDVAISICSRCFRKVEGKIVFRDGKVLMLKRCPEHGSETVMMADDVDYYRRCREVFLKPPEMPTAYNTPVHWGCPYDCGLCADHEQHSCLTLVEITDHCNLRCPMCYSASGPERQGYRSLEQVERMLDAVVRNEQQPDIVQISGGEPTLHPDFFAMLDAAKQRPIRHLMVNTNGIRIAAEEEFAQRLAGYMPDFEVYLQFDSLREEPLRTLRGADLRTVRQRALERLNRLGVSTTLVVTLQRGLNDDEIGSIIDFALQQPCVRGVTFQPMQVAGRLETFDPADRSADADRSAPPHLRAERRVSPGRHHAGAVPSRQPGDGLRAEVRRQGHAADRPDPAGGADRRRPQHRALRAGAGAARAHLPRVLHQPLAGQRRGLAARSAVLPAAHRRAVARLRQCFSRDHHAVHRRVFVRCALHQEDLRPYRASRWAADSLRQLQPVLSRRSGTHSTGRPARRCRSANMSSNQNTPGEQNLPVQPNVPGSDKLSTGFGLWVIWTIGAVVVLSFLGGIAAVFMRGLGAAGFSFGPIALVQVGAWQWIYVIPLIISLRRKQRFQVAKGVLITACVLFGVDVLCSGVVFYSLSHTSFR